MIATDLSPGALRAVDRAALLPLAPGARLELVHVIPDRAQLRRAGGKVSAVHDALGEIARRLGASLAGRGVRAPTVVATVRSGPPITELLAQAQRSAPELVVVGRHGGGGFRTLLIGSTAERIVRGLRSPVLVVSRDTRAPYRRPLVAIDTATPRPGRALEVALCLLDTGVRRVTLVTAHEIAYEGYMRASGVSDRAIQRMRTAQAGDRRRRIGELARAHVPAGVATAMLAKHGDARLVIREAADRRHADLVVLGTASRPALSRFFLGSVAADVLRSVTADVLVVPAGRARTSAG